MAQRPSSATSPTARPQPHAWTHSKRDTRSAYSTFGALRQPERSKKDHSRSSTRGFAVRRTSRTTVGSNDRGWRTTHLLAQGRSKIDAFCLPPGVASTGQRKKRQPQPIDSSSNGTDVNDPRLGIVARSRARTRRRSVGVSEIRASLAQRQRASVDGWHNCWHGKPVPLSKNVVDEDFQWA